MRISQTNDGDAGVHEPIAVVGIGCRFPGAANDPEGFWTILETGRDAISEVPGDRWNLRSFHEPDRSKPGKTYSRWGGFVEGIDRFDPHFFGISPREAARMDPQQRLLLEVAWEGLEDGGLSLEQISGSKAAVFVGISSFDYSVLQTSFRDRAGIDVYSNTGGSLSIAANRISYSFDLRGPSLAVDTACSSALVAVHLACQSIWRDGCPLALAGGVNVLILPDWYVGFCRMGMLSPEGRCRAFDARGNGFVRSEGAGMVVLKPLAKARTDGDRVYAVIRGTAVNQDGHTPGMTVPSQKAQEDLLRLACRNARVAPEQIQYVEAHGTGTPVGDPIEAHALGRVLSVGRPDDAPPCLVGSVKTNIGHLEAGSGIAGLIKVALALHHRRVPGNLHFEQPNPDIDFDRLRLRVPTRSESWPDERGPLLAGVNSFGFGGTNAHVVLQDEPRDRGRVEGEEGKRKHENGKNEEDGRAWLVPVSARGPEALRGAAKALEAFLQEDSAAGVSLGEFASSAARRRTHHDHRLAVVARSKTELAESLRAFAAGRPGAEVVEGRAAAGRRPRIAFVCSGQGPQWWAMGRELLCEEPVFRDSIERCDAIVRRLGDWSLLDELTADEAVSRMDVTAIAQPCLFAIQVALARLWASWGVRPEAVVGHSVGEVAAAHLAGAFSLDDAVRIIYHRGRCMEQAPARGRMLAAGVSHDEARALLNGYGDRVSLAALNSPASVTFSGEAGPLEEIAGLLDGRGLFRRFLKVGYAFHSAQMGPIREALLAALEGIRPQPATLPLVSTVTGSLVQGPELGPEYWWRNVRQSVRFAEGVDRLIECGCDTIVELSPHPVLAGPVAECYSHRGKSVVVLPTLRRQQDERATMLRSLGELHTLGHPVHWCGLMPEPRRFVRLPLYAWQRERCWHESEESRASRLSPPSHPLLGVSQGGPRPAWESRLDLRQTPYLADHRVRQAIILPATAYIELAFAAAREAFGPEACELRDLSLANPCFLSPDEALYASSSFDREGSTFQIHTRPVLDHDRDWVPHLTVAVHPCPDHLEGPEFSPDAVRLRCPREFTSKRTYEYLRMIGLDYGPMFQGIETVWQGDHESLGSVRLPDGLGFEEDQYLFHPALLDACLQVVIPADGDFDQRNGGLYLPTEIEQVQLIRRPGRRVWAHARLLEKTLRRSLAEIDVYDESNRPVLRIRGLHSRRIAGGPEELLDDLLHAYRWLPQPLSEASARPGRWLIMADEGGLGARLAERLGERGRPCTLVASRTDDLLRIVGEFEGPCRGVVHLGNLDAPSPEGLSTAALVVAQEAGLLSVVDLVQAWEQARPDLSVPLVLVTRGAQSVGDRPEAVAVAQAPVIGLGRVIANESTRLACKLVDLDSRAEDGGLEALLEELTADDNEDEVAWRGSVRYVHRFLPAPGVPAGVSRGGEPYRLMIPRPGTLDGLEYQALRRQAPGQGEVEIEVFAAGLNFSDVMKMLGLYPGLPDGPVPLGAECSGCISAVGEGVTGLSVGDEVVAVAGFAFGSHVVTRAELVAPKPPRLSFEEAATLPIAFLTAAYALEYLGRIGRGESVLIHSASGGVGQAAIQIARRAGAEIFATAGTPEKRAYLEALGIDGVMDSRSLAFGDEVRQRTGGRGVDMILNSLPDAAIARGLAALADYGRFLEIGKRDIARNTRLGLQPFRNNLSFFAIDLDRLMRERPAFLGPLLQAIVKRVAAGDLVPLPYRAWPIAEAVDAFRVMQQGKHIGKIVLSLRGQAVSTVPSDDGPPLRFRGGASYLITGGLGGFGLAVAGWMAERGAGTLILMSRHGAATPEARQAVAGLEQRGVRVIVHAGDVSKADDVAEVLARIDRDLPPLRGVVHAAMVLEDALLTNLNHDVMGRVLAPKMSGAWNLHTQTAGRELDVFVLFSSLSSVFGHAGQGNYAAANAFLDALAWHRRALGLPALCINWGYLGGVGYLSRRGELGERLERQGVLSFTVSEALELLERVLRREHVQVSVMRLDRSRWRGLGVTGRVSPRFAHLCRFDETGRGPDEAPVGLDAIRAAAPEDRPALLDSLLREKLARVLGTAPDRLDGDRPLLQLGIDSLMAVELRNWIEGELRVNLPIVELMRIPSVSRLAALLAERFGAAGDAEPATATAEPANGQATSEEWLARVEGLSGEQVDTLLATLLDARSDGARR